MNPILALALLLYGAFLIFYTIWGAFLVYHLMRFAPQKDTAFISSAVFIAVTVFLLLVSLNYFGRVDWSSAVTFPPLSF